MNAPGLPYLELQALLDAAVRERDRANRCLEAVHTILLALDADGRITLINQRGCEVIGCKESDLLGLNWFERVVAAEDRGASLAHFREILASGSKGPYHSECRLQARSGARRLIAWRNVAVSELNGTATGILCSGEDVTELRRSEEAARESRERMMHLSRLATVGEMAAGISHEINQPLAAITTYAQAVRRLVAASGNSDEDVTDALEQIAAQALRAGEIIQRLRNLVRNRDTRREATQINLLIEELGALTRADARSHEVRVRLELADGLPELDLDPIQIQQVLLHLVRNAVQSVQYSMATEREIVISTQLAADGDVEIKVRDTGGGVSGEMLDRLFLPFATTRTDGTGLGLAISRSIIEAHKGTLSYEANLPSGACFSIRLPALGKRES